MKYILVIADGCADDPVPELDGRTPLEYASTPNMDALASAGVMGNVENCPAGLPAGSDTAILSIFGCDPLRCYTGRAPIEAAARGIALEPGDAAFRCNLVAFEDGNRPLEEKRLLSHNAGVIEAEDALPIIRALCGEPRFQRALRDAGMTIYQTASFRQYAVQQGADIRGLTLIPPHDHLGEAAGPLMPSGCEDAVVLGGLIRLAHELLDHHPLNERRRALGKLPANGIWFWAEGSAVSLPGFTETYRMSGGVVSAVPICQGIASLVGLDTVSVPGATGELETNYEGKAEAALRILETHDFTAVHVEAPDECTHNGDLQGKIRSLEWIDGRVLAPLLKGIRQNGWEFRLLLLSDHKTLTSTRGHAHGAVPFCLYDSRRDRKTGSTFCEKAGEAGLSVDRGTKLMGMLFEK